MLSSPSSKVKDAATAFLQSVNHILLESVEERKLEVSRALQSEREAQQERDELRRERDLLVQDKLRWRSELETVKIDAERWKSASEKAEWTIEHQAETISQLRREVQTWKDQFMRVEEERTRLSTRIDNMVTEQVQAIRRETVVKEPLTPKSQGPQLSTKAETSSSAFRSAEPSSYKRRPQSEPRHADRPVETDPNENNSRKKRQSVASQSNVDRRPSTQTVIRRVRAVVEIPVKEEEGTDSEEALRSQYLPDRDSLDLEPTYSQRNNDKQKPAVSRQVTRRKISRILSEEESVEDGSSLGRFNPAYQTDDEEDDELMIGGEENPNEVYGSEQVSVSAAPARTPARRAQTRPSVGKSKLSSSKRRVDSPHPVGTKKSRKN